MIEIYPSVVVDLRSRNGRIERLRGMYLNGNVMLVVRLEVLLVVRTGMIKFKLIKWRAGRCFYIQKCCLWIHSSPSTRETPAFHIGKNLKRTIWKSDVRHWSSLLSSVNGVNCVKRWRTEAEPKQKNVIRNRRSQYFVQIVGNGCPDHRYDSGQTGLIKAPEYSWTHPPEEGFA